MKLHEFQAKALLRDHGISVPDGEVAADAVKAREIADRLADGGAQGLAVKAQVHAGGRGKGGGIRLAEGAEEAAGHAEELLGSDLVTPQTGDEGVRVRKVLVEGAVDIDRELYVGVALDRSRRCNVVMASAEGGMEIEEVAAARPEAIHREAVHPAWGLRPFQARRLAEALGLEGPVHRGVAGVIGRLAGLARDLDASLVEVNPLVITGDGEVVALDAKITIDDSALYRHPDLEELRDAAEEDSLEAEAAQHDLSYIALDGTVGCMVNGAGLAMATMDEIKLAGGEPANFLDVGGGASVERVANAFRILMKEERVRAVLINIFGGIVRCDRVAKGVIEALQEVDVDVPVVVRLQGTNAEEGARLLRESSLEFVVAETLKQAAEEAVSAAGATAKAGPQ